MAVKLSPVYNEATLDTNGNPWSGAQLFTYVAGSSTKQTTYKDSAAGTPHTNPIILDARGEPPAPIWITSGVAYKFVLASPTESDPPVTPTRSVDNISGINDTTVTIDQWVAGAAPTYVSATSFTLAGDQTSTYHIGRRLKTTNTGGTIYSTITASVFGALTTITVVNDSGTLDSGLSAVSYGLASKTNDSLPRGIFLTPTNVSKFIYGFTYANNVADATNDLDIAAGGATDATGAYWITGTALTKQSDVAWAVGTGLGGLDTGAVGNSDYYIWAIARPDTGVVDYLYSLSSTAPTMPTSYTYKRLIGWFKRLGGTIVAFHTYEIEGGGIEFNWDLPIDSVNVNNTLTTARSTHAMRVPLNFSVIANINVDISDNTAQAYARIMCPDETDGAVTGNNANMSVPAAGEHNSQLRVRTSSAGLIAARASLATVDAFIIRTTGFAWARRN